MVKQILRYLIFGIAWGCGCFVITTSIGTIIMGKEWILSLADNFLEQVVGSIIIGICCASSSIIYKFDTMKIWQQTLIHFVIGLAGYFTVAYKLNWIPNENIGYILTFVIISLVIFFAIWMCFYIFYKQEAKKMNRRIEELKRKNENK